MFRLDAFSLQPEQNQSSIVIPRTHADFGRQRYRLIASRLRIIIREIIQQFFCTDCVGRRQVAAVEETPHVAVGSGIDIDRKGGQRIVADVLKAIVSNRLVFFRVPGNRRRWPHYGGRRSRHRRVDVLFRRQHDSFAAKHPICHIIAFDDNHRGFGSIKFAQQAILFL